MSDFLPQGYSVPKAPSNYMKLVIGANKFRILDTPILGFRYWENDKPVRVRMKDHSKTKGKDRVVHFWAFPVWNYKEERVQILELSQATILKPLQDLIENPDWGDPREYDITINRKGETKADTVYSVTPSPAKKIGMDIEKAYSEVYLNLEALFYAKDPFKEGDAPEGKAKEEDTIDAEDLPF